jgi:hypothetical protein
MVAGRQLYVHPSRLDRGYVMEKVMEFAQERQVPPHLIVRDLEEAAKQIPRKELTAEAHALAPFEATVLLPGEGQPHFGQPPFPYSRLPPDPAPDGRDRRLLQRPFFIELHFRSAHQGKFEN